MARKKGGLFCDASVNPGILWTSKKKKKFPFNEIPYKVVYFSLIALAKGQKKLLRMPTML